MHRNNIKRISLIVAFVFLLTGMYFENFKIDSVFACTPFQTSNLKSVAEDLVITDTQPCTAEMLGVRGHTSTDLIAYRFSNSKRDVKSALNFLCLNFDLSNTIKSYSSSEKIQRVSRNQEQLITNYIHNSDGKKRI